MSEAKELIERVAGAHYQGTPKNAYLLSRIAETFRAALLKCKEKSGLDPAWIDQYVDEAVKKADAIAKGEQ